MDTINNTVVKFGLQRFSVPSFLWGRDVKDILAHLHISLDEGEFDSITINGQEIDLEAFNPVYDNAIIRVTPPLQTKG